ncbi:hypothetical protein MRB53_012262 [Persea americana]|uniref:Uncharacterized protein n=1 Tax=Persea americana TaxID=3435 RepID=A0ACC2LX62_PERAE|nr:hypothetical protein MRB53_012262 [Persea americana]
MREWMKLPLRLERKERIMVQLHSQSSGSTTRAKSGCQMKVAMTDLAPLSTHNKLYITSVACKRISSLKTANLFILRDM